ncbi:magnesium transporter [Candidatus Uhrbacteria bacterium]|nr:magnesium transporter [Candidatus Uhrbacteria bacterium]
MSEPISNIQCPEAVRDISFHPKDRLKRFLNLSHDERVNVLLCLSKDVTRDLLKQLSRDELADILEHLDPDQAADLVQLLPTSKQKNAITALNKTFQEQITFLSEFDPQTAAGLMNLNYIQIEEMDTIAQAARRFKTHEQKTGRLPTIVVMRQGKLIGQLPGHALGLGSPTDPIKTFVRPLPTIRHQASREEVLQAFKKQSHNKVAVLSREGNVLGIIYADSVLRNLDDKTASSLYQFAGIDKEESVLDSAPSKIRFRYKWLMINLGTAFFAASIVSLFQDTISKYVLLAVYMPIVAGMGGNAGTQTLAVLVRGIAMNQIDLQSAWPTLKRELIAGFTNGLINGLIVAVIVMVFNHDVLIALILGLAMITNLVVSAFFGTLVPLMMKKLGKDPATSATIFITTATDVLGFLFFLGLATLLLQ